MTGSALQNVRYILHPSSIYYKAAIATTTMATAMAMAYGFFTAVSFLN
jgi:hypothetical protein